MLKTAWCKGILSPFSTSIKQLRCIFYPSKVPEKLLFPVQIRRVPTPPHHNNPETEALLKEELCGYPPYQERKYRQGFQNAIQLRDHKRRQVSAHFCDLRLRLNAIRRNTVLPKETRDTATRQIQSLPRDSNWTRILSRCVMTARRRGCKTRWRISRIIWRHFADYNKMSGAMWSSYGSNTFSVRHHMIWPPPNDLSVDDYISKHHAKVTDDSDLYK